MKELYSYVSDISKWSSLNFGDQKSKLMEYTVRIPISLGPLAPLMGMVEELGEFAEVYLCGDEGDDSDREEKIDDSLSDMFIYFCDYLARENVPFALSNYTRISSLESEFEYFDDELRILTIAIGRLYHCTLKAHQGIRKFADIKYYRKKRDSACKNVFVCLNAASVRQTGKCILTLAEKTWNETVSKRDWATDPETGVASE